MLGARFEKPRPQLPHASTARTTLCTLANCLRALMMLGMGWANVSSTVLPLVGVALGTTGTLLGQLLLTRVEARRESLKVEEARRQERKAAIVDYLAAAQHAEQIEHKLAASETVDSDQALDALRTLWLAKKVIELVCSAQVAQAAHDYAYEINKNIHLDSLEVSSANERERRVAFIEQARRELGYFGEPLVRPGRPTEMADSALRNGEDVSATATTLRNGEDVPATATAQHGEGVPATATTQHGEGVPADVPATAPAEGNAAVG